MNAKTKAIDPNVLFERLRREVIEQLGYDATALRPWQEARVHALALLHLELDRMTTVALRGEPVDPKAVAVVGEQMERLLSPVFGDSPEARARGDAEATSELERLIDGVIASREHALGEAMAREEMMAAAAAVPFAGTIVPPNVKVSDPDAPPSDNVHTTYIDAEALKEPEPEHPLRSHSLNNPNSEPRPRTPLTTSPTYEAYRAHQERVGSGLRRNWSPPTDW